MHFGFNPLSTSPNISENIKPKFITTSLPARSKIVSQHCIGTKN